MTVYVMGMGDTAFTVGVAECQKRGVSLPFIAFAPNEKVLERLTELGGEAVATDERNINALLAAFSDHGTVVFFDTPASANNVLDMFEALFSMSMTTPWASRTSAPVVLQ